MKRYKRKFEEGLEDKYGEGSLASGVLEYIRVIQKLSDAKIEKTIARKQGKTSLRSLEQDLKKIVNEFK